MSLEPYNRSYTTVYAQSRMEKFKLNVHSLPSFVFLKFEQEVAIVTLANLQIISGSFTARRFEFSCKILTFIYPIEKKKHHNIGVN